MEDLMKKLTMLFVTFFVTMVFTSVPALAMDRARVKLNADNLKDPPYNLTGSGVEVSVHDTRGDFDSDGDGVIDTFHGGHAFEHNDLIPRWAQGDSGAQALDVGIHPSMTAGTIAGDGMGNANFRGFAPDAMLVTYSYDDGPMGNETTNRLADIVLMLGSGIDVANNSWGFFCDEQPYGDYTQDARVYDRMVLGMDPDGSPIGDPTVVVFSAGNERNGSGDGTNDCITDTSAPYINYGSINQPKPAKNIIAVGAIDSANNRITSFSSWGPVSDGRLKPDIVALGIHNGSNNAGVSEFTNCFGSPVGASNQQCYRTTSDTNVNDGSTFWDDRYAWFSQTSSAAAMVSGASSLLIEDFRADNAGLDPLPSTVKALLIHTATDLDDATSWYNPGPDFASGYGLVNVQNAVNQLRSGGWIEDCVVQGETNSMTIDVPAGTSQVKATLVWDDEPGPLSTTTPALVNDLDLIVTDSGGLRRFPWTLDPDNPSNDAVRTQEDHLNNVEVVQADGMIPSGSWTIEVAGTSVPSGPQCYSLVYEPVAAAVVLCDVDADGDIDRGDVRSILLNRNQPASGPDDPMDADGDGQITVRDAKICISQCTNPRCADSNGT
jgi:hypothetical protein